MNQGKVQGAIRGNSQSTTPTTPWIRAAPQQRCREWGVKKKRVGGGAKKRVVDLSCNELSADTGNKRGITSKKARGVAMSKEGSSFSSRMMTRVGKDKVGKEQCNLRGT